MTAALSARTPGAWSPLKGRVFRALWLAMLFSYLGTWMQDVGEAWVMTSTTASPLMVALLETAVGIPLFVFALPAGAMGDAMDRRKLLIGAQAWMFAVATSLGIVTLLGGATPTILLMFAFALGIGAAATAPVWQAIVPELVDPVELPAAIALSGIAFNVARALGPAVAGGVISATSPGVVFLLNAACVLFVIVTLVRWQRRAVASSTPPEQVASGIRAGVRHVLHAPGSKIVLVRAALFFVPASALWALLPTIGRVSLGLGSLSFGAFVAALGFGAILTVTLLPRVRERLSLEALVKLGTLAFAAATLVLAFVRVLPIAFLAMVVAGGGWIAIVSSLNVAIQHSSPDWVRARALAVFAIVFQGGVGAGAALWGGVAERWGLSAALGAGAGVMVCGILFGARFRIEARRSEDVAASLHWPKPVLVSEARPSDGPVLVSIEYAIDLANADAFLAAVHELGRVRRRDGAVEWAVYQDAAAPARFVEEFLVESWSEHVRQHARVTIGDRALEARVASFHVGTEPAQARHLLRARPA
ncbi:MFS transporter [Labilithrix luteola]|uniref:MFS transporter n=1 Tax=Labilithrix luteola TaxID=1391654 RepID=UPI0011BA6812|nr:MFS transporter [Labilithrix luteola]